MVDILSALLFGFVLAISVGPIALIIIQNGIRGGFKASGPSALGAALGDFSYAAVAFFAGSSLVQLLAAHRAEINLASSIALLIFGFYLLLSAIAGIKKNDGARKNTIGLRATYLLTILNPLTIIAFVAYVGQIRAEIDAVRLIQLALAVFVGSLAAQLLFAIAGARLQPYINGGRTAAVFGALSGLGVVGFAVTGLTT